MCEQRFSIQQLSAAIICSTTSFLEQADLLFLRARPIEDIAATPDMRWIVSNGTLIRPERSISTAPPRGPGFKDQTWPIQNGVFHIFVGDWGAWRALRAIGALQYVVDRGVHMVVWA